MHVLNTMCYIFIKIQHLLVLCEFVETLLLLYTQGHIYLKQIEMQTKTYVTSAKKVLITFFSVCLCVGKITVKNTTVQIYIKFLQ